MIKLEFGKKESFRVSKFFEIEPSDFTPWLSENIDYINDLLNLSIHSIGTEQPAGSFSIDILAEDEYNDKVIIENQYLKTDHDHLGKMLTYLAYHDAKTAIWICEEPRPEHEKVITWLNENTTKDFYLLKLEIIKIDESRPYPNFIKICGPSEEAKRVRKYNEELNETEQILINFWEKFVEKLNNDFPEHSGVRPSKNNWILRSTGKSGLNYYYNVFSKKGAGAAIELICETNDPERNKEIFQMFETRKKEIESDFGEELEWNYKLERKNQKIRCNIKGGSLKEEESWDELQRTMIAKMKKFDTIIRNYFIELGI